MKENNLPPGASAKEGKEKVQNEQEFQKEKKLDGMKVMREEIGRKLKKAEERGTLG